MKPNGGGKPTGKLAEAIDKTFGSYDEFVTQFKAAGATQFGSGWAWLVVDGGALVAWVSFGGVMLATMVGKVGEAAVLRETSTVFAALIGWAVLGEKVGPVRAVLMGLIALGAVLVQVH